MLQQEASSAPTPAGSAEGGTPTRSVATVELLPRLAGAAAGKKGSFKLICASCMPSACHLHAITALEPPSLAAPARSSRAALHAGAARAHMPTHTRALTARPPYCQNPILTSPAVC